MSKGADQKGSSHTVTLNHNGLEKLSHREEEVLALAAQGLLDKQISTELGVSLNSLRTYWNRIRSKVGEVPRPALASASTQFKYSRPVPLIRGEPASWELDLRRMRIRYFGERDFIGELDLEDVLGRFHPEDAPRVRSVVEAMRQRPPMPPFTYIARIVREHGIELTSDYVEVFLDESGEPATALGKHVSPMDLTSSAIGDVAVGHFRRDLKTRLFWVDEAFRKIYRLRSDEPDLAEAIFSRYHPAYSAKVRTVSDEMVATGRELLRRSYRLRFEDGQELWLSSDLRMDSDDSGPISVGGTVMAFH